MQQKLKISSNQSPSSPTSSSDSNPPNPELQSNMKNTKNGKDFHEKNGRHMSIITMADSANNDNKSKDKGGSSLSSGRVKNDDFYEVKNDDLYEMSLLLLMTFSTLSLLLNIHQTVVFQLFT